MTRVTAAPEDGPLAPQSLGVLAFGPNGVLFAADSQAAAIYAIELGDQATGGKAGAADVAGVDQKIAALLGTDAGAVGIKDLAVHPSSKHAYLSVMRGTGADAKPALLRIDGDGAVRVVALDKVKYTKVTLANPPAATSERNQRADTITDMSVVDGRLIVAGLSNEEFASKLRAITYPFASSDAGTSVEIFHGNHGRLETRSPVYTFVPYTIGNDPYLIGGYLCTPLVKFPVSALTPGAKFRGTTIAELGAGNRPIDMILYERNGKEFLLMSNTSRGVMKIPTEGFATAAPITAPVTSETGGVSFQTVTAMRGIQQLDKLDATHSIVIASAAGSLNLAAVDLP
jgi:hypothetical protein